MKLYLKIISVLFVLGLSITLSFLLQETKEDLREEFFEEHNFTEKHNFTEEHNLPLQKTAITTYFCPDDNCSQILFDLVDSSQESIYCAVYDISSRDFYNNLIEKEELDIKIVTDLERSKSVNSLIGLLKTKEIQIIESPLSSKLMHNKFCVFDEKITLVGSMNFTDNCLYKNNNDFLVIDDIDVSSFFLEKIDAYFQGDFYVKQERYLSQEFLDIYFCPDNDCEKIVLDVFKNVESSIDCMYFTFTLNDAIYELQDNNNYKNLQKRFMLEKRVISDHSIYQMLLDNNISVILDNNPNTMHNKFCVVDDDFVMTGSLNITKRGPTNEETLIFLYDDDLVKQYKNYFEKYWSLWE